MTPGDPSAPYDFVVIGGGFYGCSLALHLRQKGFGRILLIEREGELLQRASYVNQARVHQGYHYPRSLVTALRSRVNFQRFCARFPFAIRSDFTKLYAIASFNSKVSPNQFERFMDVIGAPYERAPMEHRRLFDERRIAAVYVTTEYAFDARALRHHFEAELPAAGVAMAMGTEVQSVRAAGECIAVTLHRPGAADIVRALGVLNCTYARLNTTMRRDERLTPLKHERTELALVEPPPALRQIGITVMDGPFFSFMPFPAEGLHSLSHVRYTPHGAFVDEDGNRDPYSRPSDPPPESRASFMVADAARYVPLMRGTRIHHSLFEVKTVLARNEVDDGRPILLRREPFHERAFSVLGGKIDNIHDISEELDRLLSLS